MPKSTVCCNNILGLMYIATPWANVADNASSSPLTTVTLALAKVTGAVGDTMSTNKADYTNYVAKTVARSAAGWTLGTRSVSNTAQVTFDQCGASGNTIVAAKTGVGSGAVDVWHYGDLNAPIIVSNLITPVFTIGSITITES